MSKVGLKHLRRNKMHYSGLSLMKGGFLSQTTPLWSPRVRSITDRYPKGNYDFGAAVGPVTLDDSGICMKWGEMLLWGLGIGGLIWSYRTFVKPKKNPRRRKRNGTKKGQRRKTARKAYMKNSTKKGQRRKTARRAYKKNTRAKEAMNLYHSGKARSLKSAWKMV